ncbi:MAG: glutamine--tRNA ligase/YqeY domain fusion protein [Christensenellales bacterium]|jgi:glutaminyl-tRNA synthetase
MSDRPRKAIIMPAENFIEDFINQDIEAGKVPGHIQTRFPPEPNGYLHIGHVKAMYLDFHIAEKYGGLCNLRFDDTNPDKEDPEFVQAIFDDIHWMGFDWHELHHASDYFPQTYAFAEKLILDGKAYVDEQTADEIRENRGTLTSPGKDSPWRNRPTEESLDLFRRMRAGEFPEGKYVLRAKIDMASPNMNMRDPVLYRIKFTTHHQTGDTWCIYPMYDFSHPIGDALEGVTHSLCSLEYEDHRPLYDWVTETVGFKNPPRQIEFARLNMTGTIMSKRYLRKLVEEGHVSGWDDPRMPTLRGLRRRGYTPEAIKDFLRRAGIAKANSIVDMALLEACIREELNETAPRVMAVLRPLKVVITNFPEGETREFSRPNHPNRLKMGETSVSFSREIYIEAEDFSENPPPKFFRLRPAGEVRLMGAYIIRCDEVLKDAEGNITALRCTADLDSYTGGPTSGRKVKGTIHWVDALNSLPAEIRLYGSLLLDEEGGGEQDDYLNRLNLDSFTKLEGRVQASLRSVKPMERFQFVRQGYFVADVDSTPVKLVFNRTTGLRDTWAKQQN